jgi:hypothetical protein
MGFEPVIPAIKRQQIYALDGTAAGISIRYITSFNRQGCTSSSLYQDKGDWKL